MIKNLEANYEKKIKFMMATYKKDWRKVLSVKIRIEILECKINNNKYWKIRAINFRWANVKNK